EKSIQYERIVQLGVFEDSHPRSPRLKSMHPESTAVFPPQRPFAAEPTTTFHGFISHRVTRPCATYGSVCANFSTNTTSSTQNTINAPSGGSPREPANAICPRR